MKPISTDRYLLSFIGGLFAFIALLMCTTVFLVWLVGPGAPPSKEQVAQNFRNNKLAYQQLRDMLLQEKSIFLLAPWGVETRSSLVTLPDNGGMPPERYKKYLELLSRITPSRHTVVIRSYGNDEGVCTLIWRAGLGDSIHLTVCWRKYGIEVADKSYQYFPLEKNWYIETDWGPNRFGY
jgi:hypothetical protein